MYRGSVNILVVRVVDWSIELCMCCFVSSEELIRRESDPRFRGPSLVTLVISTDLFVPPNIYQYPC